METKLLFRSTIVALALSCISGARAADPLAELASFSVFDKVDLAQLASAGVKSAHGAPMTTNRFLSVQTIYVTPGSPAQHAAAMERWNPVSHPELKVLIHQDGTNFSRLTNAPDNAATRALAMATTKPSKELQISEAEAKKLPVGAPAAFAGPVANFWMGVLSGRAGAGAGGQPPYDFTGQAIRPGEELRGLIGQQPRIQKQFPGILGSALNGSGSRYWELLQVEETGVVSLGASGRHNGPNNTVQAYDTFYYSSGGYYAGLTLYQMWPIDIGGRASTLVWRGDMISSAGVAGLHGIEKVASESQMMRDITRAVNAFRRDIGGTR